jgi:hypothetical protein
MPYEWKTELPGIYALHADYCPRGNRGACICGTIGFRAVFTEPSTGRRIPSPDFGHASDAQAWLHEQQTAARAAAGDVPGGGRELGTVIGDFLEAAEQGQIESRTGERYTSEDLSELRAALSYADSEFREMEIEDIRRRHVLQLIDDLRASGLPPERLLDLVNALQSVYAYAIRRELVDYSPLVELGTSLAGGAQAPWGPQPASPAPPPYPTGRETAGRLATAAAALGHPNGNGYQMTPGNGAGWTPPGGAPGPPPAPLPGQPEANGYETLPGSGDGWTAPGGAPDPAPAAPPAQTDGNSYQTPPASGEGWTPPGGAPDPSPAAPPAPEATGYQTPPGSMPGWTPPLGTIPGAPPAPPLGQPDGNAYQTPPGAVLPGWAPPGWTPTGWIPPGWTTPPGAPAAPAPPWSGAFDRLTGGSGGQPTVAHPGQTTLSGAAQAEYDATGQERLMWWIVRIIVIVFVLIALVLVAESV